VNRPLRENLEVESAADGEWLRCADCGGRLCPFGQTGRQPRFRRVFPPAKAGPLMKNSRKAVTCLKKYTVPHCGVLFDAQMVKEKHEV